jgi:tetratricopeptide (TPR) repeat protein
VPQPEDKNILFLVVDDQFNVRRMIFNFLRTFGYNRVVDASDGEKALEVLAGGGVGFVVSDWNMPRMNGLALLKRVRADHRWHDLPFLMVTAEMMEQIVAEAIEESVDGYIVKPFQAKTLIEKIESILDRRRTPDPLDLALRRGREMVVAGKPMEAEASFVAALEINPASPRALLALGEFKESQGRLDEARGLYDKAVAESPRFVKAIDRLAALYHKMGQEEEASRHLAKAARISPRNPRRQMDMGKLLLAQGKTTDALACLKLAQQNAGSDGGLMTDLGEVFLEAGLYQEAAQVFQGAASLNPNQVHIYNRLGIAYRRQRLFGEAVREYEKALAVAPDDENLYYNLAVAHIEAGQMDQAAARLRRALDLRPDFSEAKSLLQRLT